MANDRPTLEGIYPFFIVSDASRAMRFYQDKLGFDVRFAEPGEKPLFAIVARDSAQLLLKHVAADVKPQANHTRHEWAPWDAFIYVENPDALAAEYTTRGVKLHQALCDRDDGLRGFAVADGDGYVLFFGRPN